MPRYEYRFTDLDGIDQTVERTFKMSEAPQEITVEFNGNRYFAHRIISLTARMGHNWEVKGAGASDLPPENWRGSL